MIVVKEYLSHTAWFLRRLLLLVAATVLLASIGACTPLDSNFNEAAFIPSVNAQVAPGIEAF